MLVDCPSCGRTIRVPNPEGEVEPLPDLKLNLKDSKLTNALDELASMGQTANPFELRESLAVADAEAGMDEKLPGASAAPAVAPPVVPAPVRIEPLVPVKPISIDAPDPRKLTTAASINELAALASIPLTHDPEAEQPVVDIEFGGVRPALSGAGQPRSTKHSVATLISWLLSAGLIGFFAGFVAGRWDRSQVEHEKPKGLPKAGSPLNKTKEPDPFQEPSKEVAVRGRITFKTSSGERRPDRGARIVLLPETRTGTSKLSVAGFRSADNDADRQVAAASLKVLGGDIAVVDDNGNFEISSVKPGTYRVLALSHFQARDDRETLDPSVKILLDNYFDKPDQLLGKCQFHLGEVKVSGTQTEPWDYSFERE